MWIKCRCPQREDITLEYKTENEKFYVTSSFESKYTDAEVRLTGFFETDGIGSELEFGAYNRNQNVLSLNKFYSLSYMEQNSALPQNLVYFTVECSHDGKYTFYPPKEQPEEEDSSLTRAKEVLESLKSQNPGCENIPDLLSVISDTLSKYKPVKLPVMNGFSWYHITDSRECFNLSSVNHLKESDGFNNFAPWYFGRGEDERVCAVAAVGTKGGTNPLSNADDCTVSYVSSSSDTAYFVVGILLLD